MNNKQINQTIVWAFLLSWIGILPSILQSYELKYPSLLNSLEFLKYFGALIASLIFVFRSKGSGGIKELLRKFIQFKAKTWIVLFVLFYPFVVSFLSATIGYELSASSWPEVFTWSKIGERFIMAIVLQLFLNTEEFVWRGVVFDNWLKRFGYLKACSILSVVWWFFHIPMFLRNGGHEAGQELLPFTIMVIAMTFVMGWLYKYTLGSLFYVHVLHQFLNSASESFPIFPILNGGIEEPYFVMIGLIVITAAIMVWSEIKKKDQIKTSSISTGST